MKKLLIDAGLGFVRAFVPNLVVWAPGILSAPNLNEMYLVGVAALASSFSAGLKVLKEFVPGFTTAGFLPQPWAAWVDAFLIGGIGAFIASVVAWLDAPNLDFSRAAVVAILVAAGTAAFRALEGTLTKNEQPAPDKGF